MQTTTHNLIAQLQACALKLLETPDEVSLNQVIDLHAREYGLAVNANWAANNIEHNGIVKIVERDGEKFVELP